MRQTADVSQLFTWSVPLARIKVETTGTLMVTIIVTVIKSAAIIALSTILWRPTNGFPRRLFTRVMHPTAKGSTIIAIEVVHAFRTPKIKLDTTIMAQVHNSR